MSACLLMLHIEMEETDRELAMLIKKQTAEKITKKVLQQKPHKKRKKRKGKNKQKLKNQ